jgi:hypothetical protein
MLLNIETHCCKYFPVIILVQIEQTVFVAFYFVIYSLFRIRI